MEDFEEVQDEYKPKPPDNPVDYALFILRTQLPDLDCGQIGFRRFQVAPPDPHGFDRDVDGIGCERRDRVEDTLGLLPVEAAGCWPERHEWRRPRGVRVRDQARPGVIPRFVAQRGDARGHLGQEAARIPPVHVSTGDDPAQGRLAMHPAAPAQESPPVRARRPSLGLGPAAPVGWGVAQIHATLIGAWRHRVSTNTRVSIWLMVVTSAPDQRCQPDRRTGREHHQRARRRTEGSVHTHTDRS